LTYPAPGAIIALPNPWQAFALHASKCLHRHTDDDLRRSGLVQGDSRNMKTTLLPEKADAKSPAGADIRFLMDGATGNMIHSTVPPYQTNRATVHATVSEFWFVLAGRGEIWRDDGVTSAVTALVPGTSIDIPVGTAFQYRNAADQDLKFICITMPPWPGDAEARYVDGIWEPTVDTRPAA